MTTNVMIPIFLIIFEIYLASLLGPFLSYLGGKRVQIPVVVGQLLGGVIIGQSGLRILDLNNPTLLFLYGFGFAIVLFKVGINLPLRDHSLNKALGRGATAAAAAYVLATPCAFGIARIAHFDHVSILVLLCACSSASVASRMIDERKLNGPGLTAIKTWIPISDMSTLALLPLAMAQGTEWMLGVGIVLATGAIGFVALKQFNESKLGVNMRQLSKEKNWALEMQLYMAGLIGLCILSYRFGASFIVAGFVMGATATVLRVPGVRFQEQLKGLGEGHYIAAFFVILGAKIDMRALFTSASNIELALLIAAGALIVHLVVAKLVRLPLSGGFMAASSMGLPASIVSTGLTSGTIRPGQAAAIVTAALISLTFASFGVSLFEKQNKKVPAQAGSAVAPPDSHDENSG